MIDLDREFAAALERQLPLDTPVPDWSDVLARAGERPRHRRTKLLVVLMAASALVTVLATPALGLQGQLRDLIVGKPHGLQFVSTLKPLAGSGTGEFIATPAKSFSAVGSGRAFALGRAVRFELRFDGLSGRATRAWLEVKPVKPGVSATTRRGFTMTLCAPCSSPVRGTLARRGVLLALLDRQVTVYVATAAHSGGELVGRATIRRR